MESSKSSVWLSAAAAFEAATAGMLLLSLLLFLLRGPPRFRAEDPDLKLEKENVSNLW